MTLPIADHACLMSSHGCPNGDPVLWFILVVIVVTGIACAWWWWRYRRRR